MVYGIRYYAQGTINNDNYIKYIRHYTLSDEYLQQSQNYVPIVKTKVQAIKNKGYTFSKLMKSKSAILNRTRRKSSLIMALKFYQTTYEHTEDLREVIHDLRRMITGVVEQELVSANKELTTGIIILVLVLVISPVIIFLVKNATTTIQVIIKLNKATSVNSNILI